MAADIKYYVLRYGTALLMLLYVKPADAQQLLFTPDKQEILIGEKITFDLKLDLPAAGTDIINNLPDSFNHFEVLEKSVPELDKKPSGVSYRQKLVLTNFDSGTWMIPSFSVEALIGKQKQVFQTDSFRVTVGYSPIDSSGQPREIKPIMQVIIDDYTWWYISGAILLLAILAWLVYRYMKRKSAGEGQRISSKLSPIDEAMQELDKLSLSTIESDELLRNYHSGLSYVLKNYNTRVSGKPGMSMTTDALLLYFSDKDVNRELISELASSLRVGDAVKFARYKPDISNSVHCLDTIRKFIRHIESLQNKT